MDEKKEIKEYIYEITDFLDGKFENIVLIFNDFKQWYKNIFPQSMLDINKFHRFELKKDWHSDQGDDFEVYGYRWETDEEFNKRIETNKKAAKAAKENAKKRKLEFEKQEKEKYLKLKAKYG